MAANRRRQGLPASIFSEYSMGTRYQHFWARARSHGFRQSSHFPAPHSHHRYTLFGDTPSLDPLNVQRHLLISIFPLPVAFFLLRRWNDPPLWRMAGKWRDRERMELEVGGQATSSDDRIKSVPVIVIKVSMNTPDRR